MEKISIGSCADKFRFGRINTSQRFFHLGILAKYSVRKLNILNYCHEYIQDIHLLSKRDIEFYLQNLAVPWCLQAGRLVVATADETPENLARLRVHYGDGIRIWPMDRRRLLGALEKRFAGMLAEQAAHTLERQFPEFSARRRATAGQLGVGLAVVLGASVAILAAPTAAFLVLSLIWAAAFLANALFRAVLVWIGAGHYEASPAPPVCDSDLPLYSIIVPLYHEAAMLPGLMAALSALDYPANRVEVLLALEADDAETIAAAEAAASNPRFAVLHVPPGLPRTKPKAANYALAFVRGEFTVIYDAEDRPEPDQLRKAVAQFRARPQSVACLQARLNFYNARENWLTRMFALDYSLWFDFLLPGLDRFGIPMPLGGTSNHFRTEALRAIAGWDPCNVTEDADLGIRLARAGLSVATLDSTTFEEAAVTLGNWFYQRSRWMKGYMQTWLVHMRRPRDLLRHAGLGGFLGFQLFIGGTFVTGLANPLLWLLCLMSWAFDIDAGFGAAWSSISDVSVLALVFGNTLFAYLAMVGSCRRGWLELAPYGLAAPVYWGLVSAACYRGLWHLLLQPMYWDKTRHGMTRLAPAPASAGFSVSGGNM
ncbi:MAG: glycosyltransferase [Alphaproteobacteria bacterium]|nr:glycosyltransferase [Alphaproteobacteria bacterium]MDE2012505.1 glycosyltransferase [Alphaproteobacteria bacterium]MDE2072803.1 glycosyltransferase [Alphaproteobacteria bacterium]